jgi:uncharacterized protein YxeA
MKTDLDLLMYLGIAAVICIAIIVYRNFTDKDDIYKRRQRALRKEEKEKEKLEEQQQKNAQ